MIPVYLNTSVMEILNLDLIPRSSIYRSLIPIYLDIPIIENFDSSIFDNLTLDTEIMDVNYLIEKELTVV